MAPAAEGRRRRKNKSKKKRKETGETTVHDLPDHLFERVLLRLGPSPCLVRAAATCRRWCRVVADAGFLARLSSIHGHAIHLGDYCLKFRGGRNYFVFVPYSPAVPMALDVGRFSLDFLPDSKHSWGIQDSRRSLLLLSDADIHLLVCEPLTRRYQKILWPFDVAKYFRRVFLTDINVHDAGNGRDSMSNYRILATVDENLACVFSPGSDGGWSLVRTVATGTGEKPWLNDVVGRANGFIYWGVQGTADVLALEEATLKYSIIKLPENIWGLYNEMQFFYENHRTSCWIIGGEDGALRIVRLVSNELKVFARHQHHQEESGQDEWVMENNLRLQEATVGLPGREEEYFQQEATILTANSRYVLLTPKEKIWVFSIELDTMRVECEHERNKYEGEAYRYELPWPPVLPNDPSGERRR